MGGLSTPCGESSSELAETLGSRKAKSRRLNTDFSFSNVGHFLNRAGSCDLNQIRKVGLVWLCTDRIAMQAIGHAGEQLP